MGTPTIGRIFEKGERGGEEEKREGEERREKRRRKFSIGLDRVQPNILFLLACYRGI
jgi:hypothetical protein